MIELYKPVPRYSIKSINYYINVYETATAKCIGYIVRHNKTYQAYRTSGGEAVRLSTTRTLKSAILQFN